MDKKTAVGYIRVSTIEQAESGYSLDNQTEEIKRESEYKRYELKRIFKDRGISGASMNKRDSLQSLLQYIKQNKVDYVIIYKMSRLGRKLSDVLFIVEYLKEMGVGLISIKDSIDTSTAAGKSIFMFNAMLAEIERDTIITQVKGGMEQKAREGEWNGGSTPLGYDLVEKKLVVNNMEANLVITIFNEYLKGNGYKSIALALNKQGHKTKRGKEFNGNGIKNILMNPVYHGEVRWGYRKDWGVLNKEGKRKRKYNDNPIISEGVHDPIIDKIMFKKVQEMITKNPRHHVKQFNGNHMLSGLLRCPDCEYGMSIQVVKTKGRVYKYYSCNQYQNYKRCRANSISKDKIEKEFLGIFQQAINEPSNFKLLLKGLSSKPSNNNEEKVQIKRYETELKKLEVKEGKLLDEMIDSNDSYKSAIKRRIQGISDEIKSIEIEISKLSAALVQFEIPKLKDDEIIQVFKGVAKVIPMLNTKAQQKLVRKLIKSIHVEGKQIKEVHFSFNGNVKSDLEGDSDESPSANQSFRVQNDKVSRIISRCSIPDE